MSTQREVRALVHHFYEAGQLRRILRTHQRRLLAHDPTDTIAAHSFRVAIVAWHLAKLTGADPARAQLMALFHDLPEARTGDAGWVERSYVVEEEEKAAREQLEEIPWGEEVLGLLEEFQERKSLEARVVKDADRLEQLLLTKEYAHQGNQEAAGWLHLDDFERECQNYLKLSTEAARALAREIVTQRPSEWWDNIWRPEKRQSS